MLRGFRWQLPVFVLALLIFAAAGLFRFSRETPAPPAQTPSPSPQPSSTRAVPQASPRAPSDRPLYREGLPGSVQRLNPLFAHLNPPDADISALIYEGLFAFNDYGEVVPRLAAELVVSGDGLDYVLGLRDDILWQDGMAFGVDDVLYTRAIWNASRSKAASKFS